MSEVARLRADLAALKEACEARDRGWVTAYSELEVLANRWRIDNNELDFPFVHERPHPWGDFLASVAPDVASATIAPTGGGRPEGDRLPGDAPARVAEGHDAAAALDASPESPEAKDADDAAAAAAPTGHQYQSEYKGVLRRGTRFQARIMENRKSRSLGRFASEVEAAMAYDAQARKLGRTHYLNFPDAERESESEQDAAAAEPKAKRPGASRGHGLSFSKYLGVWRIERSTRSDCFAAGIYSGGQKEYLGVFASEVEAAMARAGKG